MAAGDGSRKVLVRRKADVSTLFVKNPPFSSTVSCLQRRLPDVLKGWSQVPVFSGPQLLRWVLMLHLVKCTQESLLCPRQMVIFLPLL